MLYCSDRDQYDDGYHYIARCALVGVRGSRVCDDVAYDGSRLCETVQSAEECGMAASDHVRNLCIVGSRNRMERLVCEYRNSGYLPADPGCNVDHIKNTFPVTERIYDLLCDGRCLFDDSSIDSFSDRSNPLQDSIGYLYRVQFYSNEKNLKKKCIKNSTLADTDRKENIGGFVRCRVDFERNS